MSMRLAAIIILLCANALAAISFHASSTDGNPNGGNVTITLPTVSNNDYVLCAVVAATRATVGTTTLAPYTTPSGWTNLVDVAGQEVIGQVWTTGAATTVVFVQQNGASSWEAAACASYTGVDTTTPIDGAGNSFVANWGTIPSVNYGRAPSVSPAYTNDQLIAFFFNSNSFGTSFATPSGLTARVNSAPGSTVYIFDKALSSGAATGNFDSTAGGGALQGGASILLKAAAGGSSATTAVQPTIGGIATSATCASDFNILYPSNGDLFVVVTMGAGTGTTISGYAQVFQTADVGLYTKTWASGTATSYTLAGNNSGTGCEAILVRNYNPTGAVLVSPTVDASGTTTAVATSTSLASSSIAANSTSDLLLAFWSSGVSGATNGNAWTLSASLEYDATYTLNASAETYTEGILQAPSNLTGTFTSTIAASARLGSGAATFIIQSSGTLRHKGQIL